LVSKQWIELERTQSVLDAIREGVLAFDASGVLTFSNSSAQSILGWDLPKTGELFEHLAMNPILIELTKKALQGESGEIIWKKGRKPDRRYFEVISLPLQDEGCVFVIRDISKIRRLERIRRDFVANISHEMRTPISIVRANAETLINGAMHDPEYGNKFLGAILRHGERLSQIIDELLEISRLESGEYKVDVQRAPLLPVIQRVVLGIEENIKEKEHTVEVQVDVSVQVYFDDNALEHILSNYVENAVKYTPMGGTIKIYTTQKNNQISVVVEDNGIGIPRKYRRRVFERFYRVDKGRSRAAGGTGLGLSVVRHFAEVMGAKVGVKPAESKGSIFWCRFSSGPKKEQDHPI